MENQLFSHEKLYINRKIFDDILPKATTEICIASSTLKDFLIFDSQKKSTLLFSDYIKELCRKRIDIKILTTPKMLGYRFAKRCPNEVKMRSCARNHLKLVCIDQKILYIGTGNLTGSAVGIKSTSKRNFEIGILTTKYEWVNYVYKIFWKIWNGSLCLNCTYRNRHLGCTIPLIGRAKKLHETKSKLQTT